MQMQTDADQYAKTLIALLKEYTDKIRLWLTEVQQARSSTSLLKRPFHGSPEWRRSQERYSTLEGPLQQLTRESSQLAEQGAVEDGSKIELSIRRAELEGLMHALRNTMYSSE